MKDLSVIIVSYNTKDFLKNCLLSIIQNAPKKIDFEIIVIDNHSTDGSLDLIEKEFPNVILIRNEENLGFSKANNIGVRNSKGKYVLFLNSDTIVYPKTLEKMVEFMEKHKEVGAATCKVVMPNGRLDDACHRGFPTPWNAFCHFFGLSKLFPNSKLFSGYSLDHMDYSKTHEIDACAGAFMVVRRKAGDEIEWWDEDFFWYGEDLDFCYRLKEKAMPAGRQGWKVYFVPNVSILHYKGVSGGIKGVSKHLTSADKETRRRASIARFEAMRIFYKKHYQDKYPFFVNWLVLLGINLKWRLRR